MNRVLDLTDKGLEEVGDEAKSGNPEAMNELCRRLRVSFVLLAKRRIGDEDLAEDLVHDALMVVSERLASIPEDAQVAPWCLAVLRNVVGNHYSARRRLERLTPWAVDLATRWHGGVNSEREDAKREIKRVLPRLPARCRTLIEWKLAGVSVEEMQKALSLSSRNALYMRLHRCRQELKRALEAERDNR